MGKPNKVNQWDGDLDGRGRPAWGKKCAAWDDENEYGQKVFSRSRACSGRRS